MERERAKSEGVSNRNPPPLLMILKNGIAGRTVWLFLAKLNVLLPLHSLVFTQMNLKLLLIQEKPYTDGCCCCC